MNVMTMAALSHARARCLSVIFILTACEQETPIEPPDSFQIEKTFYESDNAKVVHSIDDPGLPSVLLTHEGDTIRLGIFQQGTGVPIATLRDEDGDGVFDLITYSALSETGHTLSVVEDYGMDGTPDFILYFDDSKPAAKVNVGRRWIEVDGVGEGSPLEPTVEIDGETKTLEQVLRDLGRQ